MTGGIFQVSGTGSISHIDAATRMRGGELHIVSGADVANRNAYLATAAGDIA